MKFVLGIDGGGTQTRAVLADQAGRRLGVGNASSCNYQSVGFAAATQALLDATAQARVAANMAPDVSIAAACFGMAGVGRPEDRELFNQWAADTAIAERALFVTDAELVLRAGTPQGWGVALICGTGSFCWARAEDGRTTRVGGWGYLIGDEGSGYDLAIRALRLATQTADGRADAHTLLQLVLAHWSLPEAGRLVGQLYRSDLSRAEIASLSAQVLLLADQGDPYAVALIDQCAAELSRLVSRAVRALALRDPPVAMAGGLLTASERLRRSVVGHADVRLGDIECVTEPVQGAIALARALLEG